MENKILFRASSIGDLMTESRTKSEKLSKTAKAYIQKVFKEREFGYYENINSKAIDKGIENEDEAIQLASEVLGWDFVIKNEEKYSNEYVNGTPDVIAKDLLADIKCSWNMGTFPIFEEEIPTKNYWWQLQCYMWLTGHSTSELVYVLTNTPEQIVEDEIRRMHWKLNKIDEDLDLREAVQSQHNFDHLPNELRIKRFIVERDEQAIEQIKEKVEIARDYYETLKSIL
jgi:hypothetical protein